MKKFLKFFAFLLLTVSTISFVACSDDDDPADNDFFIGKYDGSVSYTNGDENISSNDGYVRVVKLGDKYNFIFSNSIPDITGVEIQKDQNTGVMLGSSETHYIRINQDDLRILYIKDGRTWTANCER